MIKNMGDIPIYCSSITGNIPIQYSLITITAITPCKKTGILEYVPSSGTYPTTGKWEVADYESSSSWFDNGDSIVYNSGKVVIGTDIQPTGNAVFTVNDSIRKISQELLSLAIK